MKKQYAEQVCSRKLDRGRSLSMLCLVSDVLRPMLTRSAAVVGTPLALAAVTAAGACFLRCLLKRRSSYIAWPS